MVEGELAQVFLATLRPSAIDPGQSGLAGPSVDKTQLEFSTWSSAMSFRHLADMVHDKNPVTLPETATVLDACQKMRDRRVGAVLVTDKRHRLVGIFTGRDAVTKMLAEGRNAAATQLLDVMTAKPSTLPPTMSSIEALRVMQDGGFRHVPVVDNDGHIVSVVSRGDFRGLEQARLDEETGLLERIW